MKGVSLKRLFALIEKKNRTNEDRDNYISTRILEIVCAMFPSWFLHFCGMELLYYLGNILQMKVLENSLVTLLELKIMNCCSNRCIHHAPLFKWYYFYFFILLSSNT